MHAGASLVVREGARFPPLAGEMSEGQRGFESLSEVVWAVGFCLNCDFCDEV